MIPDAKPIIWPLLDFLIKEWAKKYPSEFARLGSMSNQEEFRLMLFNTWVNFQKKHEFNPIHTHDGVFSFVIWHKVPFTQKDEYARFPNMKEDEVDLLAKLSTTKELKQYAEDLGMDKKDVKL